jgi:hypothetical protein
MRRRETSAAEARLPRCPLSRSPRTGAASEHAAETPGLCQGTLVSREQHLVDLRERAYADARVPPFGRVASEQIAPWADAIGEIK